MTPHKIIFNGTTAAFAKMVNDFTNNTGVKEEFGYSVNDYKGRHGESLANVTIWDRNKRVGQGSIQAENIPDNKSELIVDLPVEFPHLVLGLELLLEEMKQKGLVEEEQINGNDGDPGTNHELSEMDNLCLKWVRRKYAPSMNMDQFLSNNKPDQYISNSQFKRALQDAGTRGLIKKNDKNRWEEVKRE